MAQYLLETQSLEYQYPDGTKAVNGISVGINKGEKIAVLGSNGAGKSTFFLNLNGVLKPTAGRIYFKGTQVKYDHKSLMELRKNVGIVFQDPDSQLFSASVYQEVSFGAMNLKLSESVVRERVEKAMEDTGITDLKKRPTHFLSYGQKKRVTVADILVMEPEIIIFDEPTACLDPKYSAKMVELFDQINQNGTTILLSTHDVDIAYTWATRILVMKDGNVIREGDPVDIFRDHQLLIDANLTKPLVFEVYEELLKAGVLKEGSKLPRSKSELFSLIKGN